MTGRAPRGARASGSAGSPGAATDSPLVWNVAGLLGDSAGAARDYAVSGVEIDGGEDFQLAAPIDGRLHVSRTNRGLLVAADFTTVLATQCVRCLREITVPLTFEINDEALPSLDLKTGKAATLSEEDAETGVIVLTTHHELDLEPAIRDAILLNEPIAPLDREDCPGLCIVCGLPLDEGDHDHPDDDIDPRLEALRGFVAD